MSERQQLLQSVFEYMILISISFLVAWAMSKFLRRLIDFFIRRSSDELNADPTNFIFIKNSISFVCYSISLFWIFTKIPYFQNLGTALFASAGVLAAVVGLASQKAFSNIVGGIFLLIFRPFKIGDRIELHSGRKGIVEEITLRHTIIKDYEFRRIVIPNSHMSEDTIINSSITDQKIRKHIEIGISYDANLDRAEEIISEAIMAHPNYIDNRTMKEKTQGLESIPIKLISFGDSSINLRAFVWARDHESATDLHWDVLKTIKKEFDKNRIEIPFPHRTVVFKDKINFNYENRESDKI